MIESSEFVDEFFAETPDAGAQLQRTHRVDVVLVTHDGAQWLPRTLAALRGSTRPADAVYVVDTESADGSVELLLRAGGLITDIASGPRSQNYGASIAQAFALLPESDADLSWVWLLHDDSAPARDALQTLLLAAERHPDAWVLGMKSVAWNDSSKLQDVGLTVTGSGHRDPRIDRGERDQGQHWESEEVLAVGSAGMLLRREVWTALQGMRPYFAIYRDDIDFCWRAWEHGFRVRVVPQAEIAHREAATHGVRSQDIQRGSPHRVSRANALKLTFLHTRPWARPFVTVRLLVTSLMRMLVYFFGKDTRDAGDELRAVYDFLRYPQRVYAEIAERGLVPVRAPRKLRPSFWVQAWHAIDLLTQFAVEKIDDLLLAWAGDESLDVIEVDDSGDADAAGSEEALIPRSRRQSFLAHVWKRPGTLLFVAMLVIGLAGTASVWGAGLLQGGALFPVAQTGGTLIVDYFRDLHDVGLGTDASAAPWTVALGLFSLLFAGNLSVAVSAVIILALPLAALSAHLAARPIIPQAEPRAFFAASYALLPGLLIALSNGRLGTVVFAIALPVLLRLAWRCHESWSRAGVMTLAVAFVAAWVPAVWVFTSVWLAIAALLWRREREQRLRLAFIGVASWGMLFPFSFEWLVNPALLLKEAGATGFVDSGLSILHVLLLHPGGIASPWTFSAAGITIAAVAALAQQRKRGRVALTWMIAVITFAAYACIWIIEHLLDITDPTTGTSLLHWPGPITIVLGLLFLTIVASVADGLAESLSARSFGWQQVVSLLLVAGVVLAPVAAVLSWLWNGSQAPLARVDRARVPAFVIETLAAGRSPRLLLLERDAEGAVRFSVADGRDARLGDADVARAVAVGELRQIIRSLMSGRDRTEAQRLARYGIEYVVSVDGDGTVSSALNGAVALRRIAGGAVGAMATWQVQAPSERLAIVAVRDGKRVVEALPYTKQDGNALSARIDLAPVDYPRTLVLAEPAGAWTVTLAGAELQHVVAGETEWRRVWRIPASAGGSLTVEFHGGQRLGAVLFAVLVLIATIVVATPPYRGQLDPDAEEVTA